MNLEQRLARTFLEDHAREAALVLERMPAERRAAVVRESPAAAAPSLGKMMPGAVAECLSRLEPERAALVLDRLPLDTAIAALRRLSDTAAAAAVDALPDERQELLRTALRYPEGTAGALMDPAAPSLPDDISVAEARVRLRRESRGHLHYVFVVDRSRRLVGALEISDLLRARARASIRSVMGERVEPLAAWTPAASVLTHPGWRTVHMLPVTDEAGHLVGTVRYDTLRRVEREAVSGQQAATIAVGALGELFYLGLRGLVEGVMTAAAPGGSPPAGRRPDGNEGAP